MSMNIIPGANDRVYAMAWYPPSLWLAKRWNWYCTRVHEPVFTYFYRNART